MRYRNSLGSFFTDIFGKSTKAKERDALINLANEPVNQINPLIYLIPVGAIVIFGVIYFIAIKKK